MVQFIFSELAVMELLTDEVPLVDAFKPVIAQALHLLVGVNRKSLSALIGGNLPGQLVNDQDFNDKYHRNGKLSARRDRIVWSLV